MSIQASGLGAAPMLNMLLSIGGETLSAQARELPHSPLNARAPFKSNARAWLQSCAKAQRSLIDSGAWAFFKDSPLLVKIDGAKRFDSTSAEAFGMKALGAAAFAGAKISASLAQALRDTPWPALFTPLDKLSGSLSAFGGLAMDRLRQLPLSPEPYCDNIMAASDGSAPRKSIVHLPASSVVFDRVDGMAESAPFWSREDIGLYVALHEAGHAVHHCFKRDSDDFFGSAQAGQGWSEALRELGFLDFRSITDPFVRLGATIFSESYADCFSAIAMGAGSAEGIAARADEIYKLRQAKIPSKLSQYSDGDVEHDTREAMFELARSMREQGAKAPMDHDQIHQACLRCSGVGLLRWVQSISSNACGPLSWALWRRASSLMELPENKSINRQLIGLFQAHLKSMDEIPSLSHVAKELRCEAQEKNIIASTAGGASMLLRANALAGDSKAPLRGNRPEANSLQEALSRLHAKAQKKRLSSFSGSKNSPKV